MLSDWQDIVSDFSIVKSFHDRTLDVFFTSVREHGTSLTALGLFMVNC